MGEFTREIRITEAVDTRDDPDGCMVGSEIVFVLRGTDGAITCRIGTGWVSRPLSVIAPLATQPRPLRRADRPGPDAGMHGYHPRGLFVDAHSPVARFGMQLAQGPCTWNNTDVCYQDTSYLASDEILQILVERGSDAVFERLQDRYYRAWITERPVVAREG